MGKVLNAMKKSFGTRTPATPGTPATGNAQTSEALKALLARQAARARQVEATEQAVATLEATEPAEAPRQEKLDARPSSLEAVTDAVRQATATAGEKLTARPRGKARLDASTSPADSAVAEDETKAPADDAIAESDAKAPSGDAVGKSSTNAPNGDAVGKSSTNAPGGNAIGKSSRSEGVVQAVAAGETVIRPQAVTKTSITPSVKDMLTTVKSPAPAQTPRPVETGQSRVILPGEGVAPKPVSRAINRADTLASIRSRRGPVASRESHYFSPLVVTHNKPRCQISEQFRHIRTALIRLANRGPVRCMITSSQPREGKTVTAVNMAYCFSEVTKKRTLLIDADLRRGRVADLLGMTRKNGLSELLNGECTIEEATWSAGRENFHVITAGAGSIEQIGEMLSGDQAEQVMTNLTRMYDHIIVDSPPVISVADPAILCRWVDMALMAVRIHSTHCTLIEQATQILEGVGVHVTGLIALDDKASQRNYYRYVNYG